MELEQSTEKEHLASMVVCDIEGREGGPKLAIALEAGKDALKGASDPTKIPFELRRVDL
jgi:hypothetical protein